MVILGNTKSFDCFYLHIKQMKKKPAKQEKIKTKQKQRFC